MWENLRDTEYRISSNKGGELLHSGIKGWPVVKNNRVMNSENMVTSFMDGPLCNINKSRREEEQKLVFQGSFNNYVGKKRGVGVSRKFTGGHVTE